MANTERYETVIRLNTEQAKKEMADLTEKVRKLQIEQAKYTEGSKQWNKIQKQIDNTNKDLGLKLKQLDAVQTTVTETKDTARAEYCHNIKVFSYDDRWSHLEFSLSDSTFYYNIRDSLATVVYHEYKHRFLWWRWGVKGYKVKVVNFNPHSTIRYNQYVKPEK